MPPASSSAPLPATDPGYTRLHIAPFDAELVNVIVQASVRPDARNISFHGLQTFPEKRYGYVDLPSEAAERLRKKLDGAVLKGVKLRVQEARPKKAAEMAGSSDADDTDKAQLERAPRDKTKKSHKSKLAAQQEIVGVQLEAGRQVKRGWTETEEDKIARKRAKKDKKDKKREADGQDHKDRSKKDRKDKKVRQKVAKYSDQRECLMKTILPPKALAAERRATAATAAQTQQPGLGDDGSDDEAARAARRRKRDKKARQVVVHEFAHSTKFPTFLRATTDASAARPRLEYVDGKGWVDESEVVVEAIVPTRPAVVTARLDTAALQAKIRKARAKVVVEEEQEEKEEKEVAQDSSDASDTSSDASDTSSDASSDSDVDSNAPSNAPSTPKRPLSAGPARGLTIQIPPPPSGTPPRAADIHPLEALYKRPQTTDTGGDSKPAPAEGFSFFGATADDNSDIDMDEDAATAVAAASADALPQPPMTPYTQRELDWRSARSAAPTPDTAHPARAGGARWPFGERDEDREEGQDKGDEGEEAEGEEAEGEEAEGDEDKTEIDPATDFSGWFWANRGDLNRSWKRRRKTAGKEKRYRENRTRAGRAI